MKNVSHHKKWSAWKLQLHVDSFPIPLIKSDNDDKLDKAFVKIKLRRDSTSKKSYLYERKTVLFGNVNPEEFLLFIRNFNMTLEV